MSGCDQPQALPEIGVAADLNRPRLTAESIGMQRTTALGICVLETLVPRIPDQVLKSIIYLYASTPDAENRIPSGATAFLAGIPNRMDPRLSFHYIVTNRHVVENGYTVVRLNKKSLGTYIIDATELDWILSPLGDDLAVLPVTFGQTLDVLDLKSIGVELFATQQIIDEFAIGTGDDTYMVGRFANHEGKSKNNPSARFGCIAQMPDEPIVFERYGKVIKQESFLVESRAIPGYSGSPVFVHIPAMSNRPNKKELITCELGTWLLGIDWCHLNSFVPAFDKSGRQLEFQVKTNSGMMGVIPAWRIRMFLEHDTLKEVREKWYQDTYGINIEYIFTLTSTDS